MYSRYTNCDCDWKVPYMRHLLYIIYFSNIIYCEILNYLPYSFDTKCFSVCYLKTLHTICTLDLILTRIIIFVSSHDFKSPATETLSASQEEDVVLPCFDSDVMDPESCYRVKWIKYTTDGSQMKVILARPETPKIQDAERVKWDADENGQMSLFLTKLQKSDEGLYSCEIWQGWDFTVKNTSLKVKGKDYTFYSPYSHSFTNKSHSCITFISPLSECKALQAVKAAPSTPVTLNCPVDTTSGQQGPTNISWAMLKGGDPVSFEGSKRVEINGTSLAIQSVSSSDSAWYSCKYMLGQTQRCFDINLLIQGKIL